MGTQSWCLARPRFQLVALLFAMSTVACTHNMEVKNLHDYSYTASAPRSLKLSLERVPPEETARALATAVKDGLAAHSSVERVTVADMAPPDFHPDYVVSVQPTTKFTGSGWNYLISFPGFLIFTHAWNGYVYGAQTSTEIEIRRPDASEVLASQTLETDWNFRHCDFGRGAWTSSGWYTPGYGGLNLIIGFFMIRYDDDATAPLLLAVHDPYGQFIANHVVELAASADAKAAPPGAPPAEAPLRSDPLPSAGTVQPSAPPPAQ
jgi:hypothetical protein